MSHDPNALNVEIDAMVAIGRALASLPDPQTRQRVLRWAQERYQLAPDAPGLPAPSVHVDGPKADSSLTVGTLEDLFGHQSPTEPGAPATHAPTGQPTESLVSGFVDDFKKLVVEWQGA